MKKVVNSLIFMSLMCSFSGIINAEMSITNQKEIAEWEQVQQDALLNLGVGTAISAIFIAFSYDRRITIPICVLADSLSFYRWYRATSKLAQLHGYSSTLQYLLADLDI